MMSHPTPNQPECSVNQLENPTNDKIGWNLPINKPQYPPEPYGQPQPVGKYIDYISSAAGHAPQQPIVQQPRLGQGQFGSAESWMASALQASADVPPGLQYLANVEYLFVKQEVEIIEAITGWETNNHYTVENARGQRVFYALEESSWCTRWCCGALRSFDMSISDNYQNEVIHLKRAFRCNSCWCPCCLQKLEVYSPPGNLVGTVEQTWSIFIPNFVVKNESGITVMRIVGPLCRYDICGQIEFKVYSRNKSSLLGKISKQWSGLIREAFTDADYFGISFPIDLDVRMKAVLLGACFLIDFMYYEVKPTIK